MYCTVYNKYVINGLYINPFQGLGGKSFWIHWDHLIFLIHQICIVLILIEIKYLFIKKSLRENIWFYSCVKGTMEHMIAPNGQSSSIILQQHWHISYKWPVIHKEFISVIEGIEPAIVLQKFDSPNLSPLRLQYTILPVRLTEQAGRGWVSQIFVRLWQVLSLLSLIIFFGHPA